MNVTLPDGTILTDIPEGTTKAQLIAKLSANGYDVSKLTDAKATTKSLKDSALDASNALATGANQAMASLAGLPVDTVANVLELGKAAIGAPYLALTGKQPPGWLQPTDRSDVVGSGANIMRSLPKSLTTAQNPEYEGGFIQAVGRGLPGAVTPAQAALGVASQVAGKMGGDAYGTEGAIIAGMVPTASVLAAPRVAKYSIRGNEQGRQNMAQRIQDLRDAGVTNPTLGLASGNNFLGGTETILQSIPGSMGIFARARDAAIGGLQNTASRAAETASQNRGTRASGQAIQDDLANFYDRTVRPGYVRLNDRAEGVIGTNTPVQVRNAIATSSRLSTPNPGAPATSGSMIQPRMTQWNASLRSDQGGSPAYTDGVGMYHPAIPPTGIPYGVVKGLRTSIGDEARSKDIVGTPAQAQIKSMYGALSDDMRDAAVQSDLSSGRILQIHTPGSATGSLARSNDFYSSGMDRIKRTEPFANKVAPEDTMKAMENAAKENVSTLQAVKKSVTPETRGSVAGTIIEKLGRATAGNQNDVGDVFSPQTFLTNWNKMTPKAREELFSGFPNAPAVMAEVEAIAKATSMMRDNSRHWANPSGTAANARAAETLRGAIVGVPAALSGFMSPAVPIMALGTIGAARGASRLMTDPRVSRWAAERTAPVSAEDLGALTQYLVTSPAVSQD